jgi:hypothetical protein
MKEEIEKCKINIGYLKSCDLDFRIIPHYQKQNIRELLSQ